MREAQADAVREAPVAAGRQVTGRTHLRGLAIATLAAALMTFVGALGTAAIGLLPRLGYWLILMWSGSLIGIGASTGVRSWGRLARRPVLEGLAVSGLISLPLTLVTMGTTALFFGARAFGLEGGLVMFVTVFVITAAITTTIYATNRAPADAGSDPVGRVSPRAATEAVAGPVRARLSERLPLHLAFSRILALEAEDHYVRVHTEAGSDLLLMRLGDAVAELDGLPGARTHRSWWVVRDAVRSAVRGDGRGEMLLTNGVTAPVSRSALTPLARDGWFSDRAID